MAILGTEDFDVTQIDPETVNLEGQVLPIEWNLEDVASPYNDNGVYCGCNDYGPDGYLDLVFKFDSQLIAAVLSESSNRDVVQLTLDGELFDGTFITGGDCVVIIKKAN